MPMDNLLEYSKNYKKTIGSLYNYYRDELTNDNNDNTLITEIELIQKHLNIKIK